MDMDKFFRIIEVQFDNKNPIYRFNHHDLWEFFNFQFKMMESYQIVPLNDYQKEIFIIGCMEDLKQKLIYVADESNSDMSVPVYQWIVNAGRATYNMTYRFPSQDLEEIYGSNWKRELGFRYKDNQCKK